ncbi:hypothetical protein Tcan_00696, partial [Toxocara canis]
STSTWAGAIVAFLGTISLIDLRREEVTHFLVRFVCLTDTKLTTSVCKLISAMPLMAACCSMYTEEHDPNNSIMSAHFLKALLSCNQVVGRMRALEGGQHNVIKSDYAST